jgi:prolyl-tRNA synthetase
MKSCVTLCWKKYSSLQNQTLPIHPSSYEGENFMRMSSMLVPTQREVPAEAEVVSHQLMLRAGIIRKVASGVYSYLPLGRRVIQKVERIVREEMNAKGGQEVLMPIVQPAEIWRETGRWDVYGDEMFKLKDRHGREFCLGPTHEELITDLVRQEVRSYRQLPLMLYQIQNKYRDEIRPRFGVMRSREFIMKDLYSFDRDETGLDESYQKMYDAYCRIFKRCGLVYRAVEADPGAIGGSGSHEFMVTADTGEAEIAYCPICAYAANTEKAEGAPQKASLQASEPLPVEKVHTPGVRTIEELTRFLGVSADTIMKTVMYEAIYPDCVEIVAAVIRGDQEINEIKLKNYLDCLHLTMAGEEAVFQAAGTKGGFVGPVGLRCARKIVDSTVALMSQGVCGANEADYHLLNTRPERDFGPYETVDIRTVQAGDFCPQCSQPMAIARGIEVGHIFKLGTKYSQSLGAVYLDEQGREQRIIMGCYGIGVTRTMAAAIEQNHDEHGIIWPIPIAPYHVIIVPISSKDPNHMSYAEDLYQQLAQEGVEVILDDRDERPGVKFKDADLIGIPLRITVGRKTVEEGLFELRVRKTGEDAALPLPQLLSKIRDNVWPVQ